MIRVADYIAQRAVELGISHVFMVTGGGSMHLNDAFGHTNGLRYVCHHHEQACAIAAEGFARASGRLAMVNVTTGPGATNTVTGVLGQWLDSIPALYVSGQVRYETSVPSTGLKLRQLGDQEAPVLEIVRPITKYAVSVREPASVRYHLERAVHLARTGRQGPVWLEVPLDIQSASVDARTLPPYDPAEDAGAPIEDAEINRLAGEVVRRLEHAERPVLLAGAGVRLAGAYDVLQDVIPRLSVPVLVAWDAIDLVASDHPLYFGRPGTLGQRAANFIFQNADLVLSIGCRLNIRQIGYQFRSVARAACKVVVDIDPVELRKPTVWPDLPICCDAAVFLRALAAALGSRTLPGRGAWLAWCAERRRRLPVIAPEWRARRHRVDPYVFSDRLSDYVDDRETIVSSDGTACVVPIQALRIKAGQRHIVNSGCAAMGYGLPAAIGASFATGGGRVVCLEGDGSIQLNIQELQTLAHHRLPVKIFVFNNGGYVSIRNTQRGFFGGRLVGEGPASGLSFPDITRVAAAFDIPSFRIRTHDEIAIARAVLATPGPALCDVMLPVDHTFVPRVASRQDADGRLVSSPLEDMYPFLTRDEMRAHMLVPLLDDEREPQVR